MYQDYVQWPLGWLQVSASDAGITSIVMVDEKGASHPNMHTQQAVLQLEQYLNGERTTFDLVLAAVGTEFQQQVWRALLTIPFGETRSYQDIAKQIGNPKGVRAVGLANGKNPISIVVPCHRVIGKNGALTGYAGGLRAKEQLLTLEGALTQCLNFEPT